MSAAWLIDVDYAKRRELAATGRYEDNAEGVTGPADAPAEMIYALVRGHTAMFRLVQFRAYDHDDQLLYAGRLIAEHLGREVSEALLHDLSSYGDATRVVFPRHPELDLDVEALIKEEVHNVGIEEQPEGCGAQGGRAGTD